MCLNSGTDAATNHQFVVFKGFTKPAKGSCRLLAGYEASTSTPIPASATACLNAAGDRLYIGLIVHTFSKEGPPMIRVFEQVVLGFDFPYPSLVGARVTHEDLSSGSSGTSSVADSALSVCKPFPMP